MHGENTTIDRNYEGVKTLKGKQLSYNTNQCYGQKNNPLKIQIFSQFSKFL